MNKTITRSDISCFLFYFCWSCQRHQRESCSIKAIKSEARWNLLDNWHDLLARGCRISLAVMSETKDSSWAACRNLSLNKLAATPYRISPAAEGLAQKTSQGHFWPPLLLNPPCLPLTSPESQPCPPALNQAQPDSQTLRWSWKPQHGLASWRDGEKQSRA